ncbi:Elys [Drechmeria coniospora]|uniref:Elys n=1 Tax=Drechmeria coniospora TaxID=98403 RepID=A0A151GAH4_DRECN|nr:Elys [Drechmeria coniospora]KYK54078.1 Elys [Drechmeria coniospora]ODA77611.1 hypothetical protein RJ55_07240 [Drechmeria coniospora]
MLDYTKHQDVFPAGLQSPYDRKLQHEIEEHRKSLGGSLFIDRVMKALGISKAKLYPPKSDSGVHQLHQQICGASMSTNHKQSLLYYILLDFDRLGRQNAVSESFASDSGMPSTFQVFMKGLWHMDRQDYERALEYVAHPSLSPDFADDIVITLVRHAPGNDYSLALSYHHAVQPVLKTSLALELLFDAMARTNVTEALLFSRSHPPHTRQVLFRRLLSSILQPRGKEPAVDGGDIAFMPLDAAEEEWFEEHLTTGEGRSLSKAKETLLIRKIACDRFAEAGKQRSSGPWGAVLEGIRHGIEGHAD